MPIIHTQTTRVVVRPDKSSLHAINRHYLGVDEPNVMRDGLLYTGPEELALLESAPARHDQFLEAVRNCHRQHIIEITIGIDEVGMVYLVVP